MYPTQRIYSPFNRKFATAFSGYGEFLILDHSGSLPTRKLFSETFKKYLSTPDQFRFQSRAPTSCRSKSMSWAYPQTRTIFLPGTLYELCALASGVLEKMPEYDPSEEESDENVLQEAVANIAYEVNAFAIQVLKENTYRSLQNQPIFVHQDIALEMLGRSEFIKKSQLINDEQMQKLKRIIKNAILLECSVKQNDVILYRGATYSDSLEFPSTFYKKATSRSLSYGMGLFLGGKSEQVYTGATPWLYCVTDVCTPSKPKAIHIRNEEMNTAPFFIPSSHRLLQFFHRGEWFHPRTKIHPRDLNNPNIVGLQANLSEKSIAKRQKYLCARDNSFENLNEKWMKFDRCAIDLMQQEPEINTSVSYFYQQMAMQKARLSHHFRHTLARTLA